MYFNSYIADINETWLSGNLKLESLFCLCTKSWELKVEFSFNIETLIFSVVHKQGCVFLNKTFQTLIL